MPAATKSMRGRASVWRRALSMLLAIVMVSTIVAPQASAFADEGGGAPAEGARVLSIGSTLDQSVTYYDGVYEGTGGGRNGDITVRVTIADGRIASVEEVSQSETASYWEQAKAVFATIVDQQTYDVDGVSGATQSCNGIKQATLLALRKAQTPPAGPFSSGAGTQEDPFVISTADGLAKFATSVDGGESYVGKFIKLGADLDLSDVASWNPIGTEANATASTATVFAGSFDGAGYAISNMKIALADQTEAQNVGLFSTLQNTATVKGVNLAGVDIDVTTSAVARAGAIAGDMVSGSAAAHATIDACSAAGAIDVDSSGTALVFAGGIAGRMNGWAQVANCWTDVAATAFSRGGSNSAYAGGITGMAGNNTGIVNCATFGASRGVSPKSTNFGGMAGGLGGMVNAKVYNTYALGAQTAGNGGNEYSAVGALAGQMIFTGTAYPETGAYRAFGYYPNDAALAEETWSGDTFESSSVSPRAIGAVNNDDALFETTAMARADMANQAFADTLNANIRDALSLASAYTVGTGSMNTWVLENGRVLPVGAAWVETEPDASLFDSGTGTEEDPYKIRTEEQLRAFAGSLTEGIDYTGKFIEVVADIDVSSAPWVPVGDSEYAFNGTFDGAGHTISGMHMGTAEEAAAIENGKVYVGMFSVLDGNAVVKNVKLDGIYFNVSHAASFYLGGIAAYMGGQIGSTYAGARVDGCSVEGTLKGTAGTGNTFVGGVAGLQYKGAIINTRTDVDASCIVQRGNSVAETGGIVGLVNRGLVANNYALGDVYGSASRNNGDEGMASISGIAGVNGGNVVNCYAAGSHTTGEYSVYAGTISGWVTGIGKAYDSFYNGESTMTVGTQAVNPVQPVGTKVPSGVSEEGDVYTGGVVDALNPYTAATYASVADTLNANFSEFAIDISLFGLSGDVFKKWTYDAASGEVTFGTETSAITYVQPEVEIVPVVEKELRDGTWYGRDADKASVVKIVVEGKEVVSTEVLSGPESGEAYDAALAKAKEKSIYGDTTDYEAPDPAKFAGGTGTAEDPYQVATEEQLRYIADRLNADNSWEDAHFLQTADIALSSDEWLPIGWGIRAEINNASAQYCMYPFLGNYDGGDFAITGLTIGANGQPSEDPRMSYAAGFVGAAAGEAAANATPAEDQRTTKLANIHLKDVDINVASRYTNYVGALAGNLQNGFYVDNCSAEGAVSSASVEAIARAGGLVGNALRGQTTNSWTDVAVNVSTDTLSAYAGGLYAMDNRVTTLNCYVLGDVAGNAANNNRINIGGFAGQAGGYYYNCYNAGGVNAGNTTTFAGLFAGNFTGIAAAIDCYYNSDAALSVAGTSVDPVANGRTVSEDATRAGIDAITAQELASAQFAETLNASIPAVADAIPAFKAFIESAGLSSMLYYAGDGSDLLPWVSEGGHAVFGEPALEDLALEHVGSPLWVAGKSADIVVEATNLKQGETVVKWYWEYTNTPDNPDSWKKTGAKSFSGSADSTLVVPECTQARKAPMCWRVSATTSLGRTATSAGQSLHELKALEIVPDPEGDFTWELDKEVRISAKVAGLAPGEEVASYTWYYSRNGSTWKKTGAKASQPAADTLVLSGFKCTEARKAPMAWCVKVTTSTGRTYTSEGMSLVG